MVHLNGTLTWRSDIQGRLQERLRLDMGPSFLGTHVSLRLIGFGVRAPHGTVAGRAASATETGRPHADAWASARGAARAPGLSPWA